MRRPVAFGLALIIVALVGATAVLYSKYQKSQADYQQLTTQEAETRNRYGQAIDEIAAIQDSLNTIVLGEEPMMPGTQPSEVSLPPTSHEQVMNRISELKAGLERTKVRIQELDEKLKHSGVRIAGLQKMISGLKKTVVEKEQLIAQLDMKVDTLETRVSGLTAMVDTQVQELAEKQLDLTQRQRELATVFYTIGTKKDLIRSGVVVAEGGVLGFGKTLKPSGAPAAAAFTALNTDEETVIRIPAKKAEKVEVLSQQAVTSYVIQQAGEGLVELRIVNPQEFRKIKQLVIMTS